jgi:hypothetical protein
MPYWLIFTLRVLAFILGLSLIYLTFLYKHEEGPVKNKLEDLWIKIDDLQQLALSRQTAFMKVVAETITSGFNLIFGKKLISLQSLIVSVCYSIASIAIPIALIDLYIKSSLLKPLALIFVVYEKGSKCPTACGGDG